MTDAAPSSAIAPPDDRAPWLEEATPAPGRPHPLTLAFPDPAEERRFRGWFFDKNATYLRIAAAIMVVVVLIGGPLERLALPEVWSDLWRARYGVILPAGLLGTLLMYSRRAVGFTRRHAQELIFATLAVGLAGTGAMGHVLIDAQSPQLQLYSGVGYVLVTLLVYISIRLRFLYATVLGWTSWLLGVQAHLAGGIDPFVTSSVIAIGAAANVMGMYGAYVMERASRREYRAELRMDAERRRVDRLLDLVLPPSIAGRLRADPGPIADEHAAATVLFADIVGFTPLAASLTPEDLLELLSGLFWAFDTAAERHGVEKIKTIGDAWMAVAGAPEEDPDHAAAMARVALELIEIVGEVRARTGHAVDVRVGMHSGRVVAGVIGRSKLLYDLWGDAVNIASRMESHGAAGRVQVSAPTRALLGDGFELEDRGPVEVKGRGRIDTFWLGPERPEGGIS